MTESYQSGYLPAAIAAVGLHIGILALLLMQFSLPMRSPIIASEVIQATLIDGATLQAFERKKQLAAEQERQRQKAEEQRLAAAAEQKRQAAEEKRLAVEAEQKRQQAEQERQRQKAEEQRLAAAAEQKRQAAEQKRLAVEAEQKRQKAEQERQRADQERQRLEAERKRQEAEQQRLAADQERQRKETEQRELEQQREWEALQQAETARRATQTQQLRDQQYALYIAAIRQQVERHWSKPAAVKPGDNCQVLVQQIPGGEVVDVQVQSCKGNSQLQRSVENAVYRSSPLPQPPSPELFERTIRFTFVVKESS